MYSLKSMDDRYQGFQVFTHSGTCALMAGRRWAHKSAGGDLLGCVCLARWETSFVRE